jgi:multidrug efflux pump subunit AcrB
VPNSNDSHYNDLIGRFANHGVAANLLMVILLLAGIWGVTHMNRQFFPSFSMDVVSVRVVWAGASAEDVANSITVPLEQELRQVDGIESMSSTSAEGISSITLEFTNGTDMQWATERVKEQVNRVRSMPTDTEEPKVSRRVRHDPIARVVITSSDSEGVESIRSLVYSYKRELMERGIAKIYVNGLPDREIAIELPMREVVELGISHRELGEQIRKMSRNDPSGDVGDANISRQLRTPGQLRGVEQFSKLTLQGGRGDEQFQLGSISDISYRAQKREDRVFYHGLPAVEMRLMRAENSDSLESAQIMVDWMDEVTSQQLPQGVEIHRFDEGWTLISERLSLLINNGAGGLLLVVAILFLFLNGKVAFWVAVGIPTSFMATLAILYAIGGSINMVSLFALIMALGIIVDDAIVVGENALAHYQRGEGALHSAEGGARRMFYPVLSSSLTTVAAFLPLMLIGGQMGKILIDIPIIIICVLIASLIECFLILPGHLQHTFSKLHHRAPSPTRIKMDEKFNKFREFKFEPMVRWALHHRGVVVSSTIGMFILSFGLVVGGHLSFSFFPSPEGNIFYANVDFVSGTPKERVDSYMQRLQRSLYKTENELGGSLIKAVESRRGVSGSRGAGTRRTGDQFGSMIIELIPAEDRELRVKDFIRNWKKLAPTMAGLETLTIEKRNHGPAGKDLEIRLTGEGGAGDGIDQMKAASNEIMDALRLINGVLTVEDDLPYGKEQMLFSLSAEGHKRGISLQEISSQLHSAFEGREIQVYSEGDEEIEVRIVLPDSERREISFLDSFMFITKQGDAIPLLNIVEFKLHRGFEVVRHSDAEMAVNIMADIDAEQQNADELILLLEESTLPEIVKKYPVSYSFEGKRADQRETLSDMKQGGILALLLIYIILAWVFSSYGWPLVVMATIPFGIIGAFWGHWIMGMDITLLSLFGLFALSGIVVNDSIILVSFYHKLRQQGVEISDAIVAAAGQRLRAVILTSLTTIAGLLPLLFERSLQAQYLIPMAISISFGLAVSTLLVLFFVPSLLSLHESISDK